VQFFVILAMAMAVFQQEFHLRARSWETNFLEEQRYIKYNPIAKRSLDSFVLLPYVKSAVQMFLMLACLRLPTC